MKILITGAYGFVGTNLSAFLKARGHQLVALDIAEQPRGAYSEFFSWNDLGRVDWSRLDAVVHLAGKAHDTRNASDEQSYFDINVGLTKKVLEAAVGSRQWARGNLQPAIANRQPAIGNGNDSRQDAKTQGGESGNIPAKKFLLFSSVKAVADQVEGVLTEDALPDPKTPYGKSKLEAEGIVKSSFVDCCGSSLVGKQEAIGNKQSAVGNDSINELTHSRTNELLYYILRPCMIHGPKNKGNLNVLYSVVRRGLPWPLGAFENHRSFASIGNVCAVVEELLTRDAPAGVYQVADDEALSTNELIGVIAETSGHRARVWKVPPGLVLGIARVGDVLHLPLNSERLKKLTESYVVSNAKIKKALGWDRMPIRAEEGMRKTIESFSRQGAKE